MGNSLGGRKTVKVMKITGETFKLKTPVKAGEVVRDYPGHVLLESEAVKHYGTRAKPLEQHQDLVAKRLYFLVELPKPPTEKVPRRVRSGIQMSAKDRLENLMLARRSVSDLTIMKNSACSSSGIAPDQENETDSNGSITRVKMRLPKSEVEKLMKESKDDAEVAAKLMDLCISNDKEKIRSNHQSIAQNSGFLQQQQQVHRSSNHDQTITRKSVNAREKRRVSFVPVSEGEMQIAVASY
ncbi:uncharacterized protein At1g66480 [Ricinus communis]|uniref:uncharacterized protein At1g66480 n=1 Tax=Ricinus communis TaxID=3988 RepID=UPI00201A632E|nr:uncharacterized protein At1g66480 [Ricinus communis]